MCILCTMMGMALCYMVRRYRDCWRVCFPPIVSSRTLLRCLEAILRVRVRLHRLHRIHPHLVVRTHHLHRDHQILHLHRLDLPLLRIHSSRQRRTLWLLPRTNSYRVSPKTSPPLPRRIAAPPPHLPVYLPTTSSLLSAGSPCSHSRSRNHRPSPRSSSARRSFRMLVVPSQVCRPYPHPGQ